MKNKVLAGNEVRFIYVSASRIEEFFKKIDVERVEIFKDNEGKLYIIDKGDLDLYWLRKDKIKPVANEFLEGVSFDLF